MDQKIGVLESQIDDLNDNCQILEQENKTLKETNQFLKQMNKDIKQKHQRRATSSNTIDDDMLVLSKAQSVKNNSFIELADEMKKNFANGGEFTGRMAYDQKFTNKVEYFK